MRGEEIEEGERNKRRERGREGERGRREREKERGRGRGGGTKRDRVGEGAKQKYEYSSRKGGVLKDYSFVYVCDTLTSPRTVSALSISVIFWRKSLATDLRASSGHSENQSMVQQFTRLGNCLRRARKTSPMGLQKKTKHTTHFKEMKC